MRLIIDNDKYQIYARTDYALSEITLTDGALSKGATSFDVINSDGFATDDYILIEDIGNERAEVKQITISDNTFTVAALGFNHDNKTKIYRLQYNQVKFLEDGSVLATVDIQPGYFTKTSTAIDADKVYSLIYLNSATSAESPEGEEIDGWEYNLCSIGDIIQYENASILGNKVIDKIDIASREVRNMFISQDQEFTDLSSRDIARLRKPVALRALYYIFSELIKNKDDIPSQKAEMYQKLYKDKIKEVLDVINKQNSSVQIWGQSRVIR